METIRVPLDLLVLDPNNARQHPDQNLDAVKKSLAAFGQVEPLVVQESTSMVIGGNARLQCMREMGWTDAAVVMLDIDDDRAKALGVALNRTAELAEWNEQNLGKIIAELKGSGFDGLELLGFGQRELDDLEGIFKGTVVAAGDVDPLSEWTGMPEYVNGDKTAHRSIVVHFKDDDAVAFFAELVEQKISDKTKYIWFPEMEIETALDKRYEATPDGTTEPSAE
jgi:hypothetical protein